MGTELRIGVDVGGTFTDLVLADGRSGRLVIHKEPSTPAEPAAAVMAGIARLLERAGLPPDPIDLVVHGTTLGLNAIIQRRGARTALVVSAGNRDVLELARSRMPSPYDFSLPKEPPLVSRDLVFEVAARTDPSGEVLMRPDEREVERVADALRQSRVEAVAVMLINSYIAPELEREVADALRARLNGILVTESAAVWPEIREYERASIATMNAYVNPLLDRYFTALSRGLDELRLSASLYITTSNGGTITADSARSRPVDTLLSGPASGVVAASKLAARLDRKQLITIDMGGTSCDMAIIQGGEPEYTTRTHVGDFPLVAPVVSVSAIGAGGGSIVWVDNQGVLKVGPESAGADPGPACYGRGGVEATITDCYLATGMIAPESFLGGRMRLDLAAAKRALEAVADRLGITGDRAAQAGAAALRVATAKMVTELQKGLAQRGLDPRGFTLIPFGGAGPTHSALLAEEARISSMVIPPAPGIFCALGAIQSDVKRDFVRSIRQRLTADAASVEAVRRAIGEMESEALDWIRSEGDHVGEPELVYTADMRYVGQAYELTVPIPPAARKTLTADSLSGLFHSEHQRVYSFPDTESLVELITIRVRVVGRMPPIVMPGLPETQNPPPVSGRRRLFSGGEWHEVPVLQREDLRSGHSLEGPAILEQEDSTLILHPGWRGRVDPIGNVILVRPS